MDIETAANIDTDAFLPPSGRQQSKSTKLGKKRTISTATAGDEQMQIDESTGIEGARKTQAPKSKRKKPTNVEIRKIAVPSHRFIMKMIFIFSQRADNQRECFVISDTHH